MMWNLRSRALALCGIALLIIISSAQSHGADPTATIEVHAKDIIAHISPYMTAGCIEDVNHSLYGGIRSQMVFGESFQEPPVVANWHPYISGRWKPLQRGTAKGAYFLLVQRVFTGTQSQQMIFDRGDGEIGLTNQGLDDWGMNFLQDHPYELRIWAKADAKVPLYAALENQTRDKTLAEDSQVVSVGDWQCLNFILKPNRTDHAGRLALKLKQPGTVYLGFVSLQPGDWGRFKGLPVRKDIVEGLQNQGITAFRLGGSMTNNDDYRWKKMIGPPDRRQPSRGLWYPYLPNSWGIVDFLNLCEATHCLGIPDFSLSETPADMADFLQYANGSIDTSWGAKRAADGHPEPYKLKHLEIGNEEHIDQPYFWDKFQPIAEALWSVDATVIPVVGDFFYSTPIVDPNHIENAAVTSLEGHRKILELAKQHNAKVWFDVHLNTNTPAEVPLQISALMSLRKALSDLVPGAKFKLVVFELNSNIHNVQRALANAVAITELEKAGDNIPVVASANTLQPDGKNDDGWDQGLLFFNPGTVWLQPPGYVTKMVSNNYLPACAKSIVTAPGDALAVTATTNDSTSTLVLQVTNISDTPVSAQLRIHDFLPTVAEAHVTELTAPLDAVNTAASPEQVKPQEREWAHHLSAGAAVYTFPAHSFSILKFN